MEKIPAYKRFLRVIKILLKNSVIFPVRFKKLLNHIYNLEPIENKEDKNINEVELADFFPGIMSNEVILRDIESEYGSMTLEEMYNIALLVRKFTPKSIFEFGTFIGVTTLQMALNSDTATKIYTLNLPSSEEITKYDIGNSDEERNLPVLQPGDRFDRSGQGEKIVQLYGDSAVFDYSDYKNKIDLILVDASHEYEYVKIDTENSFNMLKTGGTLIWHDYPNAPGVYRYLNEIAKDMKIYHVRDTHIAFTFNFKKNI